MDTDKLRYFSTVAETGSLTKASQILGISHSGLSKAITALEIESKIKLFRPQGRGLEITSEGKWFYQKAQEILKVAEEIHKGRLAHHQPFVRIGLSGVIAMTCAGALADEIQRPLLLREVDVGETEGAIISGDLDFGFAFTPSPQPELEYLELGEVQFGTFVRQDLLTKSEATQLPFAVPASEFPQNPLGYRNRDGWPSDIARNSYFAVSSFAIALDLLRSGKASLYMPNFVASLESERARKAFKIVPVKDHKAAQSKRKLYLVKRQTAEESSEMKKSAKIIRRVCCIT